MRTRSVPARRVVVDRAPRTTTPHRSRSRLLQLSRCRGVARPAAKLAVSHAPSREMEGVLCLTASLTRSQCCAYGGPGLARVFETVVPVGVQKNWKVAPFLWGTLPETEPAEE